VLILVSALASAGLVLAADPAANPAVNPALNPPASPPQEDSAQRLLEPGAPPWRRHRPPADIAPGLLPGTPPEHPGRGWRGEHPRPPGWDLTPEERRQLRQDIYRHGRDVYRDRPEPAPRP
jgi:hypothetical protein